ncbi:MAG: hypothetical protein ACK4QP_11195 [Pseudorhizobium sp.]
MNMAFIKERLDTPFAGAMILSVTETRDANSVTRTMELDGQSIYFRVLGSVLPSPLAVWDFAVIASIFTAMRRDRPLHVGGPVSRSLLRNLEEFQEAWATWLPGHYHVVPITADEEVDFVVPNVADKGVFAFSGGLDATFSLLRHVCAKAGRRTVKPVVAALVQGFDLPLGNSQALSTARESAESLLASMGVPLVIVETNWKRDLCYNWRMEHAAGLAACLNQFNGVANIAVIGGDEGYDKVDIPWGSNPVSNPMLSSDAMPFRTEGSSYTRSERLSFIAEHSDLAAKIRVCWEAADTGANCGTCEKCIRTQMNFHAVGVEPTGFTRKAGFWRMAMIPTRSLGDNYFLMEAQKAATRRGIYGWWRVAGFIGMGKNLLLSPVVLAKNTLKSSIRKNERLFKLMKGMRRNG